MIDKQNVQNNDKPKGNDKPGGGSQVPQRQQGKKIAGEKYDKDIKNRETEGNR